jgi:hypothetical protein
MCVVGGESVFEEEEGWEGLREFLWRSNGTEFFSFHVLGKKKEGDKVQPLGSEPEGGWTFKVGEGEQLGISS